MANLSSFSKRKLPFSAKDRTFVANFDLKIDIFDTRELNRSSYHLKLCDPKSPKNSSEDRIFKESPSFSILQWRHSNVLSKVLRKRTLVIEPVVERDIVDRAFAAT